MGKVDCWYCICFSPRFYTKRKLSKTFLFNRCLVTFWAIFTFLSLKPLVEATDPKNKSITETKLEEIQKKLKKIEEEYLVFSTIEEPVTKISKNIYDFKYDYDKFYISSELKSNYKNLVNLILATKSMDDKERQFWFDAMATKLTSKEIDELHKILDTEKKKLKSFIDNDNEIYSALNEHRYLDLADIFIEKENKKKITKNKIFDIDDEIMYEHKELIELMLTIESMDDRERQDWFYKMPSMTSSQIDRLRNIFKKEKKALERLGDPYIYLRIEIKNSIDKMPINNPKIRELLIILGIY